MLTIIETLIIERCIRTSVIPRSFYILSWFLCLRGSDYYGLERIFSYVCFFIYSQSFREFSPETKLSST